MTGSARPPSTDRRARRTRDAVRNAFNHLFLGHRQRRISAADLIAEAKVGRSTFYDHYTSADDVLLEALRHPFATLADAAAGRGDPAAMAWLTDHFWENRQRARDLFDNDRIRARVSRLLADMVQERLDTPLILPPNLAATQLAEAALAPLRAWVKGEAPAPAATMAETLCRTGAALRAALTPSS